MKRLSIQRPRPSIETLAPAAWTAAMRSGRRSARPRLKKSPFHRELADLGVELLDGGGLARLF